MADPPSAPFHLPRFQGSQRKNREAQHGRIITCHSGDCGTPAPHLILLRSPQASADRQRAGTRRRQALGQVQLPSTGKALTPEDGEAVDKHQGSEGPCGHQGGGH